MHERELKAFCRALGDVTRISIVRRLASQREVNVTELAGMLLLSQPLASWHLRILKRAGILLTRKNGRQVYCSLDRRRFVQFQAALNDLIESPGARDSALASGLVPEAAPMLAE